MNLINFLLLRNSDGFEVSVIDSFVNILTTPKNTVVMLPEFGTAFNELIDRTINEEWLIDYRRAIVDASMWETRKILTSVDVLSVDAKTGSISTRFNFTDGSFLEGSLNGF